MTMKLLKRLIELGCWTIKIFERMAKMSKYHTVLFKSRNKDNKHLEGFKERSKTFLSNKPVEELVRKFKHFAEEGISGELSRWYMSVNSRDIKKANTKLVHYLIDNPEFPPHKLQTKLVSLASEKDCAVENKWLFDCDGKDTEVVSFVELVEEYFEGKEQDVQFTRTVSGFAVTVPHGFDTRELLKEWPDVSLHRDGQLLVSYMIK